MMLVRNDPKFKHRLSKTNSACKSFINVFFLFFVSQGLSGGRHRRRLVFRMIVKAQELAFSVLFADDAPRVMTLGQRIAKVARLNQRIICQDQNNTTTNTNNNNNPAIVGQPNMNNTNNNNIINRPNPHVNNNNNNNTNINNMPYTNTRPNINTGSSMTSNNNGGGGGGVPSTISSGNHHIQGGMSNNNNNNSNNNNSSSISNNSSNNANNSMGRRADEGQGSDTVPIRKGRNNNNSNMNNSTANSKQSRQQQNQNQHVAYGLQSSPDGAAQVGFGVPFFIEGLISCVNPD